MDALPLSALTKDDIVIAVMGITGSGKSSFINLLAEQEVKIGHELQSCTSAVEIFSFVYNNTQRVYLIDTPGFDDSTRTDADVLKDVAFFLSQTFQQTVRLKGIVYLQRITDNRMGGSSIRNLAMFKKLCGQDALRQVVLATTMWGKIGRQEDYDHAVRHEAELKSRDEWWGMMRERGSKVLRHTGERDSALRIVGTLLGHHSVVLEIQREMVIEKKSLQDTAAGQEVEKEIFEARKRFKEEVADLQQSYEEALKDRDQRLADELLAQKKDMEAKIQNADLEREKLKISLDKLAEEKTEEYNALLRQFKSDQKRMEEQVVRYQEQLESLEIQYAEDAKKHELQLQEGERKQRDAEQRLQEFIKTRNDEEIRRLMWEKELAQQQNNEAEKRFQVAQLQKQQQEQQLQASITQLNNKRRKRDYILPVLNILAGAGTVVAGVLTANPVAIVAGVGIAGIPLGSTS